jgi:hypothetical protein
MDNSINKEVLIIVSGRGIHDLKLAVVYDYTEKVVVADEEVLTFLASESQLQIKDLKDSTSFDNLLQNHDNFTYCYTPYRLYKATVLYSNNKYYLQEEQI